MEGDSELEDAADDSGNSETQPSSSSATGLALTEKTRMLMHPTPLKHAYEIADALEKW